jgi:chemotaxis protein methyltransferase CheR
MSTTLAARAATPAVGAAGARDFSLSDAEFAEICRRVKSISGIRLGDNKRELVFGRLARRLRARNLASFADYLAVLDWGDAIELVAFCNAITTNLTAFFRESHHFDQLCDQILRPRLADLNASRRIRIWSSACSSGEEPYSIAMTVCEAIPGHRSWDVKILATDIDSELVAHDGSVAYQVSDEIASMITFKQPNLMHRLPVQGPFEAIFCRNVVIYFDKDTQRDLFARFAPLQRSGQILFLGHSESLLKVSDAWELVGKAIYRRRAA